MYDEGKRRKSWGSGGILDDGSGGSGIVSALKALLVLGLVGGGVFVAFLRTPAEENSFQKPQGAPPVDAPPKANGGVTAAQPQQAQAVANSNPHTSLFDHHYNDPDRQKATKVAVSRLNENPEDREVLGEFARKAGHAGWKVKAGWLTDAPVCAWHGVTCDDAHRVSKVALSNNNLDGSLPPSLAKLKLETLILSQNQLRGHIPLQLKSYQYLDLSWNRCGSILRLCALCATRALRSSCSQNQHHLTTHCLRSATCPPPPPPWLLRPPPGSAACDRTSAPGSSAATAPSTPPRVSPPEALRV
jgi:hypothetical protein